MVPHRIWVSSQHLSSPLSRDHYPCTPKPQYTHSTSSIAFAQNQITQICWRFFVHIRRPLTEWLYLWLFIHMSFRSELVCPTSYARWPELCLSLIRMYILPIKNVKKIPQWCCNCCPVKRTHTVYTVIGHLWMRAVLQGASASCTVAQEIVAPLKLYSAVLHSQQSSISNWWSNECILQQSIGRHGARVSM